ncbi:type II toxin-antitoxin system VapC family toxin [Thermococcus sp.]
MVHLISLRLKVGPKGRIVTPNVSREVYGINERGSVIILRYNPRPSDVLHIAVTQNNGLQVIVSEDGNFGGSPLRNSGWRPDYGGLHG